MTKRGLFVWIDMVSCPCYVFLEASAGIPGVQRVGLYVLGYHGVHADDSPIADGCTLQDFDIPTQPDMISDAMCRKKAYHLKIILLMRSVKSDCRYYWFFL